MNECTIASALFDGGLLYSCDAPGVWSITAGCMHEHIVTSTVCAKCARQRRPKFCGECYEGPDGHDCIVRVIERKRLVKAAELAANRNREG